MSFVPSAGRPAALARRHPSGPGPAAPGPGARAPRPVPPCRDQNNVGPVPRSLGVPPWLRDITDLIHRIKERDAHSCRTLGTGAREILYSAPVRPAIQEEATAVPAAPRGRRRPLHQMDRRSVGLIRIVSGARRPLARRSILDIRTMVLHKCLRGGRLVAFIVRAEITPAPGSGHW
jgi:hypothetical protein